MKGKASLFLYSIAILWIPTVEAQSLGYTLLRSDGPPPRFDGAIAYDAAGQQVFLFGGEGNGPANDLWIYSLQANRWSQVLTTDAPAPRFGHTLIFDPMRRRVILFGGQAGTFYSDTWAFDIAQGAWRQLSPNDNGPARRYGHSAIYDAAHDRMVISHGFTDQGRFDDTWAFDLKTNGWTNISPAGSRPLRRCLHHAVYDPAGGQMYLYGGCASGFGPCPLGDLWSFDLTTNQWTERTPKAGLPPARLHYGMVFDTVRNRLVVFGGEGNALLNDTWEFDPAAGTWQQANIAGQAPTPRQRHESAFASDHGAAFFFGGMTDGGNTNELWMLAPQAVTTNGPRVTGVENAFSFQPGPVSPGEVVSIFGSGLGPAAGVSSQFDRATRMLPTTASGVSVTWNGTAAPLFAVRSDQVNVQVPYEVDGAAQASLVVTVTGTPSTPVSVPVAVTAPGLYPAVLNGDNTFNSPSNPAHPGGFVTLFGTGQGLTNPRSPTGVSPADVFPEPVAPVTLRIGDRTAEVFFRGQAPESAGVIQINARLPSDLTPGDALPVVLTIGAEQSQSGLTMAVK